jgi:hypothetical protein
MSRGREAGHVGPDLGQDDFGGAPVDTREGVEQLDLRRQRGEALLDLPRQPLDGVLEVLNVREQFTDDERMVRAEGPSRASRNWGSFLRSWPRARSANAAGSRVPSTRAASIARPETPRTSEATELRLMPAS